MMVTTLGSVPWIGGWLATLALGAPFPGAVIIGRLYILHVFIGPALITLLIAFHVFLVVRLSHTNYPSRDCSDRVEVGAPLWPVQTARSTALVFLVFATASLAAAFFPVEAVEVYGPFQSYGSYPPLSPDWFLMWIEGAFRMVPRQLDFHLFGANWTQPFYGAVVLPLWVFAASALYPLIDARIYGSKPEAAHLLEPWQSRPFRTAWGVSGLLFLVLLSMGVLNDWAASVLSWEVWQVNRLWGIITLLIPPIVFVVVLIRLRRHRR
jgi:ubiquinol-cytochrome c reductase cytochrome b subunit